MIRYGRSHYIYFRSGIFRGPGQSRIRLVEKGGEDQEFRILTVNSNVLYAGPRTVSVLLVRYVSGVFLDTCLCFGFIFIRTHHHCFLQLSILVLLLASRLSLFGCPTYTPHPLFTLTWHKADDLYPGFPVWPNPTCKSRCL